MERMEEIESPDFQFIPTRQAVVVFPLSTGLVFDTEAGRLFLALPPPALLQLAKDIQDTAARIPDFESWPHRRPDRSDS